MSERAELLQAVMPVILKCIPKSLHDMSISESTELSKDLGINSATAVEMILDLEEMLMLKPGDSYAFRTVGDLVDYVALHRNATP
jgi:acyl carrier protein